MAVGGRLNKLMLRMKLCRFATALLVFCTSDAFSGSDSDSDNSLFDYIDDYKLKINRRTNFSHNSLNQSLHQIENYQLILIINYYLIFISPVGRSFH